MAANASSGTGRLKRQVHLRGPHQREQRQQERGRQQDQASAAKRVAVGRQPARIGPHVGGNPARCTTDRRPGRTASEGTIHHALQRTIRAFKRRVFLNTRGNQRVDARQSERNRRAEGERRKIGRVEKASPELVILHPASRA